MRVCCAVAVAVGLLPAAAEEGGGAAACCTAPALAAFVASRRPGSRRLCPRADMASDMGTLTVSAAQTLAVVGAAGSAQPRFFGRFVLDDRSGAALLLQRVSVRGRNATRLPGCATNQDVHCLGAAAWVGEPSSLTARDSAFSDLSASDGGAIYVRGGRLTLQRVVFDHASADYSGGAIFAALMPEPIVVEDSVFISNEAGRLGGKCSSSLCLSSKKPQRSCGAQAPSLPGTPRASPSATAASSITAPPAFPAARAIRAARRSYDERPAASTSTFSQRGTATS